MSKALDLNNLMPSNSVNENIKEQYAHADCAAFADILSWRLDEVGVKSTVMCIGYNLHYLVRIDSSSKTLYCDAYGVFTNIDEVLYRYSLNSDEVVVNEVVDHEESCSFKNLIQMADLYMEIVDNNNIEEDEKEEDFHIKMSLVVDEWIKSLSLIDGVKLNEV